MSRADIVLLERGEPRVVVEAKGRPIRDEFSTPVMAGLRTLVAETHSDWSLLADPVRILIYHGDQLTPHATLPTSGLLASVGLSDVTHVGEPVLLIALDRWLRAVQRDEITVVDPALAEFFAAVRRTDEVAAEYLVA